ncbi:hypothetical protein QE430_000226 [Microbacterium testaceum]|nr:hypothetical protein [Microbacterium testaceum]MDQ1171919.1 hypothetical protein [Microbacterium testaceum]
MTSHMSVGDSTRRLTDAESPGRPCATGSAGEDAVPARREVAL